MVYVCRKHKSLLKEYVRCLMVHTPQTQDRLQKRKERLQAIRLQPDGHFGHLIQTLSIAFEKSHQNDE